LSKPWAFGGGFAQDFFREAVRVNIGGVEQVNAGFETDIGQPCGLLHAAIARAKKLVTSSKRSRAKTQGGDLYS
jgi:hypothetical protein